MKNSRLIAVFNTLDFKEMREFQRFIRSPFFNQDQQLVDFYDFLLKIQQKNKPIPTKKETFKKLYPNQVYKDVKIRLLMSGLHKLIDHYIVYKQFFQDPIPVKVQLANAYRLRNLPKHFEKNHREALAIQEANTLRGVDYYYHKYQLQLEYYRFISSTKRTEDLYLQELSDTIDLSFIILKLRQTCFILAHQQVYKKEYNFGLFDIIIAHILENELLQIPGVAIYYYCYLMLKNPQEGVHFNAFQSLIYKHSDKFPTTEIRDLYLLGINYCIKRINEGNEKYLVKTLDLYKAGLKGQFFLEDQILSRFTFNNIVAIGILNKELDWVASFLDQYTESLEKKYRENTFSFNKARLEYTRKNYQAALTLLQKSEYKDLLNNLNAKTLLIKIYYELGAYDSLDSHLDAMKNFIRRNKIIGYHQENYQNIIAFTRRLLGLNSYDKNAKTALREALNATKILTEKEWLLSQI